MEKGGITINITMITLIEKLSHIMTLYRMKCFFQKKSNLEKLSTFVNSFTVCIFCNNPIRVQANNDKSVGLACFLKIVRQNEKFWKSKINSSANMSNKNGQFFEINRLFVLACRLIGHGHSFAKKLTSVLNMTRLFLK